MYLDALATFSDNQAVTTDAISNVIDLGATNTLKDIGDGKPLYLVIQIGTAWAAAGTVTFSLESDSAAGLDSSATVHWTSTDLTKTNLTAGLVVAVVPLPLGKVYERYLGVRYNVTTSESAGTVDAFLTANPQNWSAYDDNIVIV